MAGEDDGGALLEDESGHPAVAAIREMFNCQMLANPLFLLLGVSNILGMLGFYTPFVYLPSMAKGMDFPYKRKCLQIAIQFLNSYMW